MEKIPFYKFESTGNDFILIDDRFGWFKHDPKTIRLLCDRHMGIGADGLIALQQIHGADFLMTYFNSDGYVGSFCGNGGRAVTAMASLVTDMTGTLQFIASDGLHRAEISMLSRYNWHVKLSMQNVRVDREDLIDTGSPHHVRYCEHLQELDIAATAPALRYNPVFGEKGCNVNFIRDVGEALEVRTYERGVESETLSCGTGVTAAAIFHALQKPDGFHKMQIFTAGGELEVAFMKQENNFSEITLSGKTRYIFEGMYYL